MNKDKFLKYLEILIIGILLPTIVAVIGYFIEYNFFVPTNNSNDSTPKSEQIVTKPPLSIVRDSMTENKDIDYSEFFKDTIKYTVKNEQIVSEGDRREVKILPFFWIDRHYNWAERLLGWFFCILPVFISFAYITVGDNYRGWIIGCLFGLPVFMIYWFIVLIVVLIYYLPLIYFLGIELEFVPLIYSIKIYESWINGFLSSL